MRAGLEAELSRANARADNLVAHYERLLSEQYQRHQVEKQEMTKQWERDRAWLIQQHQNQNPAGETTD